MKQRYIVLLKCSECYFLVIILYYPNYIRQHCNWIIVVYNAINITLSK